MAYSSNVSPGNPPLNWGKLKTALDQINENFSLLGSSLAQYAKTTISNIDQSNPVKVSCTEAHSLTSGQEVTINLTGVSQLDGNTYYVRVDSDNEVLLYSDADLTAAVDGTAYDVYPSGGGEIQGFSPFASVDYENFRHNIIPADTGDLVLGTFAKEFKELHISEASVVPGSENNGLWLGLAKVQGIGTIVDLPLGSTVDGKLIINPDWTFFKSVEIDNGDRIVADEFVDTINLISGTAIQLTADSGAEAITITNTGVTQNIAGAGISVSSATGNVTVTNTGVVSLTNSTSLPSGLSAGTGISVSSAAGNISITNTGIVSNLAGFGITVFTDTATGESTITNNAPAVPTFQTFAVQGQPGVSPDNTADTIEFVEGYGIRLTTDAANDKITFDVDNRIDIIGSVFADDSSVMVDAINNELYGTIKSTNWQAVSDSYLTIANGGATGPGPIQIVASANLDLSAGSSYNINATSNINAQAGITGDLVGSVFGDDSTKIVDAVENKVYAEFFGNITGDVTGNVVGNLTGNVTGNVGGNVTGNLTGNSTGYHTGDVTGSVFAQDSTLLVDAVDGKIVGPILSDNIRGSFIGTVFADDSSLIINELGEITYTATTPGDWNGTAPITIGEAIDRLATLVKSLNGGTGA